MTASDAIGRDGPVLADATTRAPVEEPGRRERTAGFIQRGGAWIVLVLMLIIGSIVFPDFASSTNFRNIAIQSSFLALAAIGMTFVIVGAGIDLSVGSMLALGSVLAAYGSRWGSAGALLLPLVACASLGLINGILVGRFRMAPFIVTLAALLGVRGIVLAVSDEGDNTFAVEGAGFFSALGKDTLLGIGYPVYIAIFAFALAAIVLNRTRFGQSVFAVGGSEDSARLMGLPVTRVTVTLYVISATLAGLAGALLTARSGSGVPKVGEGFELLAIAAVVIGGTLLSGGAGTLGGTLAGVLLLGVIQNFINQIPNLNASYQALVSGLFLIVVVVVQTYLSREQRL